MPIVPSLISAAIQALGPGGPTIRAWNDLPKRPELAKASLAIVGNAGYLADLDQGARIDGHDLVLRMNNFCTAGFERHVGKKLDIFCTTFHHDIDLTNPALSQARLVITAVPFNIARRRSAGLQHRHAAFISAGLKRLGRTEAFAPSQSYFLALRQTLGRYPSTGAMAIQLAADFLIAVCGPVFITGFSFFTGQAHYFSAEQIAPRNHDPLREMAHLRSVLTPHVVSGRVQLDPHMSQQLGFSRADQRAA